MRAARELKVSYEIIAEVARLGRLPVINFAAGGIATQADAALMMTLGCDGVFVGSGIFESEDPAERPSQSFWPLPSMRSRRWSWRRRRCLVRSQ